MPGRRPSHAVRVALVAVFMALVTARAHAQTTVNIWPGVAPGSERWSWKEKDFPKTPLGPIIENVVTPTLTVYRPEPAKATGTGIIVAPGGSCVALTIGIEGDDVARWLQSRGIAAFLIKYRLKEKTDEGVPRNLDMDEACKYGIADATRAIKVVRLHASEWGVAPNRIGIIGFSAGGMLAAETAVQNDATVRPNFAALIYGAPFSSMPAVPAAVPPIFMAWAQDDAIGGYAMVRFYRALTDAGDRPEAHIYSAGGHGFALKHQGTTSDHWPSEFSWWLQARGFTKGLRQYRRPTSGVSSSLNRFDWRPAGGLTAVRWSRARSSSTGMQRA